MMETRLVGIANFVILITLAFQDMSVKFMDWPSHSFHFLEHSTAKAKTYFSVFLVDYRLCASHIKYFLLRYNLSTVIFSLHVLTKAHNYSTIQLWNSSMTPNTSTCFLRSPPFMIPNSWETLICFLFL